jgi:two-component system response regulator DesR
MIRVLLAEDIVILRTALVSLLTMEADIEVVAEVETGDEIVPAAVRHQPDVAVLDIGMPGTDGLSAAIELREAVPDCRVLILTSLGRPADLQRALNAKLSGFLLKDVTPERLAGAIRDIAAGNRVIDPDLLLSAYDAGACPLSEREVQVLRLTAAGAEAPEIAEELFLSVGTVRNYLTAIVAKLDAKNRIDAIRIAEQAGWI